MSFTSEILALSPMAYWRCNDASSSTTIADSSGNGYTLSKSGTTDWNFQQPSILPISDGAAASAVNPNVATLFGTAAGPTLANAGDQYTVILCFESAGAAAGALFAWGGANALYVSIDAGAIRGGTMGLYDFPGITTGCSFAESQPVMLAVYISTGHAGYLSAQFSVNGRGVTGSMEPNYAATFGTQFYLGYGAGTYLPNVPIQDVALFNGFLTTTQVEALATAGGFASAVLLGGSLRVSHLITITSPASLTVSSRGTVTKGAALRAIGLGEKTLVGSLVCAGGVPYYLAASLHVSNVQKALLGAQLRVGVPVDNQLGASLSVAVIGEEVQLDAALRVLGLQSFSLGGSLSVSSQTAVLPIGAMLVVLGNNDVLAGASLRVSRAFDTQWVDRKYSAIPIQRITYGAPIRRGRTDITP